MSEILKAAILGILQGLTEFLPISSSGHLILLQKLMDTSFDNGSMFFELMLHVGSLIPLIIVFFREILGLFKKGNKTIWYLIISSIPAVLIMFFLGGYVENIKSTKILCFLFLITAVMLFLTDKYGKRDYDKPFTWKSAMIMGLAQGLAVLPGISRSGMTISAGILTGHTKKQVATFSFFMSIIVIAGSAFIELITYGEGLATVNWTAVIVGMTAAAVSGYFAISVMLRVISTNNYKWFCIYLLGVFTLTFIDGYIMPIL